MSTGGEGDSSNGGLEDPPDATIELVTIYAGEGIVVYHPDGMRMTGEWIVSDVWIDDIREHD